MKPAQRTLHHITAISLAGIIVGLAAAFATAGFVELVQYLNDRLFISALSRASIPAGELAMITIAVLTLGGLIVGLLLHYAVAPKYGETEFAIFFVELFQFRHLLPAGAAPGRPKID